MAARKVTVTLPEELVDQVNAAAAEAGIPVSRLVSSALERDLQRRLGRALMHDWQAEHGAFTPAEIAAARAEMAAADAAVLSHQESVA
jgi:post-segregation antitoxin (ccd killing protein)